MAMPFRGYDSYYDPPDEWECPECGSVWLDNGSHYCEDCGYEEYDPRDDEPQDFDEWRDSEGI